MDKDNLELLKKELLQIREDLFVNLSKRLFVFSLFSVIMPCVSKAAGFGYPFIIDTKEGYRVSINKIDNLGHKNNINRNVSKDYLKEYKDFTNKIYVYSDYNGDCVYDRNVSVYEIDGEVSDYQAIIDNYKDYMIDDNMIDNYREGVDNSYLYNLEDVYVEIEYCDITRDEELDVREKTYFNLFITSGYIIFNFNGLFLWGNGLLYDISSYKGQSTDIKKKIREIKKN